MHPETDKIRLLELLDTEYAFFERTLEQLTLEQMQEPNVEGTWSVKDTLCHLVRWLRRLLLWVQTAERGEQPAIPESGYTWAQMDALNDLYIERDREVPVENALGEFRRAHFEVVELVERLSEENLFASTFGGVFTEPIAPLIMHNTYLHYHEHLVPIRAWMAGRGWLR